MHALLGSSFSPPRPLLASLWALVARAAWPHFHLKAALAALARPPGTHLALIRLQHLLRPCFGWAEGGS